jgi:hypothetical protein
MTFWKELMLQISFCRKTDNFLKEMDGLHAEEGASEMKIPKQCPSAMLVIFLSFTVAAKDYG